MIWILLVTDLYACPFSIGQCTNLGESWVQLSAHGTREECNEAGVQYVTTAGMPDKFNLVTVAKHRCIPTRSR